MYIFQTQHYTVYGKAENIFGENACIKEMSVHGGSYLNLDWTWQYEILDNKRYLFNGTIPCMWLNFGFKKLSLCKFFFFE